MTVYTEERPASANAIAYVLDHLWAREDDELRMLGTDRQKTLLRTWGHAQRGPSMALSADGKPIFILGACLGNNGPFTWFWATDAFEKHASRITRTLRREVQNTPGVAIFSPLPHPQAERWFSVLGFKRDHEWQRQTAAGYPLYRFVRSNDHV